MDRAAEHNDGSCLQLFNVLILHFLILQFSLYFILCAKDISSMRVRNYKKMVNSIINVELEQRISKSKHEYEEIAGRV